MSAPILASASGLAPTLTVRVARKRVEAQGICGIELVALDGAPLPAFEAGAHVDLHLADGIVRQYSLCNPPGQRQRYQLAILRDPASRGGSAAVHERIEAGQTITISAPRNHFPLLPAGRSLLFAGGIGITPIIAMAEALSAAGADFALHYSAKSPDHAAFVERITAAPYAARVHAHYDSGDAAQRLDADAVLGAPSAGTQVYVCGPGGYIDYVLGRAAALGWPSEQIHREHFGAAPVDATGDGAFDVRLASSGRVLTIPAGSTVVQALAAHGIEIPVSCEQGVCGTCLTRVLDGVPCHRDLYLTDQERAANDQFLPCCSRASSPMLVLDL